MTAGKFDCRQRGKTISVASGGLYVLNASEPFEVDTSDKSSTSAIILPSDLCRLAIRGFDDNCCEPGCGTRMLNDAVVGLINGLFRDKAAVDPLWLRDMFCSFVDAALNPRYRPEARYTWRTSETARRLILDAIRQVIQHGLHSERFGISDAAQACKVSPRHIQSVLKDVDTTFSQELLAARLCRAAELLRSPARGTKQVAQIANECGFRNHSHFSTRYKERFGVRPSGEIPRRLSLLDAF